MGIGLTEEHLALAASVRGLAKRTDEHAALAGQGLLGLHLSEKCGGQGYGLLELCVALEVLGELRVPGPYLPTVVVSAVLARSAGRHDDLIRALAGGSTTAAVALPADGLGSGGGATALGARDADLFLLPVGDGDWAVVGREDVLAEPADGIDLDRVLCSVTPRRPVPADRVLTGAPVREIAAVLLGADACGVAAWAVATAADYAKVREQFGRPIGQFQGVKHRAAAARVALEQARAAVWDAARALDAVAMPSVAMPSAAIGRPSAGIGEPTVGDGIGLCDETRLAVGVAAVLGPDAAVRCAADMIQVLGSIGYTFEHDAHRYYRRALSDRMLAGDPGPWAEEVAGLAVAGTRRAMEPDLPEEAAAVRDTIRAEAESLRAEEPAVRRARFAREGWIMPYLPRPWGRDASPLEQVIIHQEFRDLKRPNLGIAAWAVPSIVRYGTREQQERFLPGTLAGEIVWCQLFSEPGAGSDLAGLSAKATKVEGGWSLTGQKIWTSLAQYAHWGICLARTAPERPKHDGISYFLVDMSSPGVAVRPLKEINGEEIFNEVFLDDVFVPDDLVVGAVNEGWRVARDTLSHERVALGDSWGPGSQHTDMVKLIARLPTLRQAQREQAGRLWAEGQAISALGLRVTLSKLSGADPGAASSVRKLLGMRHAQAISEFCWSLAPADPYWNRMILTTRAFTIGGGTTEVQLNIIAERVLGLPRDP
ncbi:alkylation response protein AidB-like acyl-CoA dehydrogenase [Nonomuraea polychroma]|uniref:Alkylation response protein AidB-like acyl-CoA dehydrogenase n=1 Tax=Nonomuraea polychroma TaxID=46176 RepID=A0A438MBN5_9ACTN|nr:acyl-CoA dehydrogenase [Nonomuraea polychroma]RVX43107.1 alkylation response protein AidB-like acyl-CoA dehydrogenase [Nonomuraea polychroma]